MLIIKCRHFFRLQRFSRISHRSFGSAGLVNEGGLVKFPLTDIGEGITEVELIQWFVSTGDNVAEFDPLCEVMSDKANVNITSPIDGNVQELHYKVGEMAFVGKPLVTFQTSAGASANATPAPTSEQPSSTPAATPSPSPSQTASAPSFSLDDKIKTTPAVRRIAKENNIDLSTVQATGPQGRILKEDVLRFLKGGSVPEVVAVSQTPQASPSTPAPTPSAAPASAPAPLPRPSPIPVATQQDRTVQVTGVQKFMVKKMVEANAVPQFGYGDEICMDRLIEVRSMLKPVGERYGVKLSFLPFILKATSLALSEFPMLNAHAAPDCNSYVERGSHNLGVAIDSPQGLVVPNIKDCQQKSVIEIAQDLDGLIQRVRVQKTTKEDITGGTFTLSNIGAIGGTVCRPIVFVPEVMIGALGKTQKLPAFNSKNEVVAKSMMHVAWSADHRLIDGATVARFSNRWKDYIERPEEMMIFLK